VKVGDLVKLAEWCEGGPVLMQVTELLSPHMSSYVKAIFMEGKQMGVECKVNRHNIFTLETYDNEMHIHREKRNANRSR
jgi:hypothetical protein